MNIFICYQTSRSEISNLSREDWIAARLEWQCINGHLSGSCKAPIHIQFRVNAVLILLLAVMRQIRNLDS
jgi:hypothetical protein